MIVRHFYSEVLDYGLWVKQFYRFKYFAAESLPGIKFGLSLNELQFYVIVARSRLFDDRCLMNCGF